MFGKELEHVVIVNPEKEVPLPGASPLKTLEEKAEKIIENFKAFCRRLGGRLEGSPYSLTEKPLTCILPASAGVRVNVRKSPIYGPGDKIERWYVDLELEASLKNGKRAWFNEASHTVKLEAVRIKTYDLETEHTEYWSPAFEWTKLEALDVKEIGLRTHPVNNDIEIILSGEGE